MKNILGNKHKKTWEIGHCACCGKKGKIRTDITVLACPSCGKRIGV